MVISDGQTVKDVAAAVGVSRQSLSLQSPTCRATPEGKHEPPPVPQDSATFAMVDEGKSGSSTFAASWKRFGLVFVR